jgi:hypothetical protein
MAVSRTIRVLVAAQAQEVYEILEDRDNVQYDIALYTGTIVDLLPDVQLIIIDYPDLVEYPVTEVEVRERIQQASVVQCTSSEFIASPDRFLGELVINRPGAMLSLPDHYCLALVSYSGGTGRTTLAMDAALYHAETMGKRRGGSSQDEELGIESEGTGTMLAELTFGVSALVSVTGLDAPHLYQLTTDADARPQSFKGVDLLPMDYENVRVLSTDYLRRFLESQVTAHQLSIIDATWPHSLADAFVEQVDLWLVLATERPDTVVNAQRLADDLRQRYGEGKVWLVQNDVAKGRKRGNGSNNGEQALAWDVQIPEVTSPDSFRGEMGSLLLSRVFAPIWEDYTQGRGSRG